VLTAVEAESTRWSSTVSPELRPPELTTGDERADGERRNALHELRRSLRQKSERPRLRHRFADAGYHQVVCPTNKQGVWYIKGSPQAVYGRDDISDQMLLRHAQELNRG
jgi:hypothetical protein